MKSDSERRGKITNLDELKKALDVENVLKKIGYDKSKPIIKDDELRDFCPIHRGDKQRSFCFNISEKIAYCHSCNFKGDVFDVYKEAMNLKNVREAAQELADGIGFSLKYEGAIKTNMPSEERMPQQVINESKALTEQTTYLKSKCVDICNGLYIGKSDGGYESLVVPLSDVNGILKSIQFIQDNGRKFYLKDSEISAAFFVIDKSEIKDGDSVYLAEGLATALTIWMACDRNFPVVSFGSCCNLEHTVNALVATYPNIKLRICLDYNEAAFNQAYKLQNLPNCSYCWPYFEGLNYQKNNHTEKDLADFNDIVSKCRQDISIVKTQLTIEHDCNDMVKESSVLSARQQSKIQVITQESEASALYADQSMDTANRDNIAPFEETIAKECIKYFTRSLEDLVADGTDNLLRADVFTGTARDTIEAIIKTHETEKNITINEVALNASDDKRENVYRYLKEASILPEIKPEQAVKRINMLTQEKSKRELKSLLNHKDCTEPIDVTIERVRNGLDCIQAKSLTPMPQDYYLCSIFEDIENPKNKPISTGFTSLDRLLDGGLKKGELGILTGGAGAGKSAFALQLTDQVAAGGQAHVIYVSMEVSRIKLTQRSLKRLVFRDCSKSKITSDAMKVELPQYEKFCGNITIVEGYPGMRLSEIRGLVLSLMCKIQKEVFLIIDPYQRLSTGNEKIDFNNETLKTGILITDIKDMANKLNIPVLVLSDTVKQHKDNISGEGAARGSYMNDHIADYTMMLRTSRDPWQSLYGVKDPTKSSEEDSKKNKNNKAQCIDSDDPFSEEVRKIINDADYTKGFYHLRNPYDKYASLVTPKYRDGGIFNPLFVYRPYAHLFLQTNLWDEVFKKIEDKD